MKLFFLKDDSLYKIYKTLEKVSSKKPLIIYIDEGNEFFTYLRWGKQIKELVVNRNLIVHFVAKNKKIQQYYESLDLPVLVQHTTQRIKAAHAVYQLIFNIKQFHAWGQSRHQYVGYIILLLEGALIVWALYLMSMLIVPGVTISITPSMNTEDIIYNIRFSRAESTWYSTTSLSVPIKTWSLQYEYSLALSVRNAQYLQQPAQWVIAFTNNSTVPYSLIKGTQIVSEDGVLFRTNHRVSIPPRQWDSPGIAYAEVIAAEIDTQGNSIGPRGNIPANTPLLVRNLRNSFLLKQVTATNSKAFVGGSSTSMWVTTQRDIDSLSGKLVSSITQQASDIIKSNIILKDDILLPIKAPKINILSINVFSEVWSKQPLISGTIIASIEYEYALWNDIEAMYREYISQRPSSRNTLITIQKNTLTFFDQMNQQQTWQIIIPSRITLVRWYDLSKDTNGLIPDIKNRIAWESLEKAQQIVLSYPEIATASFSITPPWYTTIPLTKSRITIK